MGYKIFGGSANLLLPSRAAPECNTHALNHQLRFYYAIQGVHKTMQMTSFLSLFEFLTLLLCIKNL